RSVATHSDVEHWALKVLYEYNEDKSLKTDEEGHPVYTKAAEQYAEEIREIIVDEYQDTNFIQEYIVRALSGGKPNVFMVGDVKQSIYRFRQACPELFLEKYHTYERKMPGDTDDGRAGTTIVFDRNFRSRKEVVDITNFVFNQFMIEEIGGINYEDGNGLVYGEQYDNVIDDRDQTGTAAAAGNAASRAEVCADTLAAGQDDTCAETAEGMRATAFLRAQESYIPEIYFYQGAGDTGHMAEAEKVAEAIMNVVGKLDVCFEGPDGKKHLKKASFSDIAILTRVNDNPDIERALENYGIPYFKKTKKGFYKSIEIKLVLNLLRIIDNPRQDIPMAAVLTSPIACFSADDLAILKINCKESFSLYKALKDAKAEFDKYNAGSEESPCAGTQEEAENAADAASAVSESDASKAALSNAEISCFEKAAQFMDKLENWRERSVYMDLPGFISYLFRDSEILNIVGAMPGGTGRRANVEFFRTQAANYTAGSYSGLFGYLRYLDALIKADVEAGNQIEMSGADAVQIMTMHGSKGLEFPVCIVPLLGKEFNKENHNIIVDRELGIGVDIRDIETHKTKATLIKNVIAQKNKQEGMAESLRLLYVAMTRAQEKLILTGSYRYYTSQCNKMSTSHSLLENHMDRDSILDSACFQVLMSKALVNHKNGEPIADLGGFAQESSHHLYNAPVDFYMEAEEAQPPVLADPADLPDMDKERLRVIDFIEHASDKAYDFKDLDYFFSFVYAHEAAVHMPVKVTASGLEDKSIQRDEDTVLQTGSSYYAGEKNLYESVLEDEFSDSEERACEKPEKAEAGAGRPAPGSKKQGDAAGSKSAGKKFLSGNQYSERGNAYHRFMELYDYSLADAELLSSDEELLKEIDSNMDKMTSSGRLSEEWAEYIEKDKILTFLKNDIGLRMRKAYAAGTLKREQQFVMGMDKDGEFLLLQGIIDAYFIEDGKIILLDYKTDKPKAEEAFIKTYKPQADAYSKALEAAFSMNVGEKLLYSFSLGRTINIQ
ncbi:MAG: UvrD-helicase domain-containing protein, partial [Parasporobacterium sp.]|nr:UvrD-helicase domain-containing protein [Parasporobacterium sp.]